MYVYSDVRAKILFVETACECGAFEITNLSGAKVDCPVLCSRKLEDGYKSVLDASALQPWSLDHPVLYWIEGGGEKVRFGHTALRTFQNSKVLLNDTPIYARGYIRGIVAHDHPNMTGESDYIAAKKNISQAKKYGFNLVRFHSTIPSEDFVCAADELGLLVHMEIGFAYETDSNGEKHVTANNSAWTDTILKFRNHPSVAIFCIGNEMHNAGHFPEVRALYEEGKRLAPNKLILDNTGWGEFDRTSADLFNQHIAYFFPYKHHRDMFTSDNPWMINGSVSDEPMNVQTTLGSMEASVHRYAIPVRPTLSHEAVHYIDIPDYDALCKKYDAFAARVGKEYLEKHQIKKPRFMTEIPALIARKGLSTYMPDYIEGSQRFRRTAIKLFLERLRLSQLCGFEMLQFSDCFKYENKNGIVDCFDDDKDIDADWFRQFNGDVALLKDQEKETYFEDETVSFRIFVSNFAADFEIVGDLCVLIDGIEIYSGKAFRLAGGLQELVRVSVDLKKKAMPACREIKAVFTYDGKTIENAWSIWTYPHVQPETKPICNLRSDALRTYLEGGTKTSVLFMTDAFDEDVFAHLEKGETVLLLYKYGDAQNKWQMPGAMERFKPCIWDRGSNLGGFVQDQKLCNALALERYFDLNMQKLLECGSKINLDHFPCKVNEIICGIDKPARDRMQGLVSGNKSFNDDDLLRRFSHLFSLRVDKGLFVICTLNLEDPSDPVVQSFVTALVDHISDTETKLSITADELKTWLDQVNAAGFKPEDIMNRFWEQDNKPVEDVLFWEEHGIDLASLV